MTTSAPLESSDFSSYSTIFDAENLNRKGLCPITTLAHKQEQKTKSTIGDSVLPEGHSLYFEIHGDGVQKVILIMGLNGSSFLWHWAVDYFAGIKEEDGSYRYSVLVFDNRGVGNSGAPKGPYSTSGMANDVLLLLDYVGWTNPKQVHVVGVSMGGMIALELASRMAPRIISLSLIVSSAGGFGLSRFTPMRGVIGLLRLVFTPLPDDKIKILLPLLCPAKWLEEPATGYDRPDITNYDYVASETLHRLSLTRPQPLVGALSQLVAGLTHHVSPDRLAAISKAIPKVFIVTGDEDNLVNPINSFYLKECMPEAELEQWENTGHSIVSQRNKRLNARLERVFSESWAGLQASKALAANPSDT